MGPVIHIVREVSNMFFNLANTLKKELEQIEHKSIKPAIDWDARIFTGLDIWNAPNRWDNVDDSHKQMFWD